MENTQSPATTDRYFMSKRQSYCRSETSLTLIAPKLISCCTCHDRFEESQTRTLIVTLEFMAFGKFKAAMPSVTDDYTRDDILSSALYSLEGNHSLMDHASVKLIDMCCYVDQKVRVVSHVTVRLQSE